jgi:RNA polymerase sigma-70 factor (ECF subfamily)
MEVTEIYTQFRQSLLSFIRSKIRSTEDAEDILQNVFIKISSSVNTLSENEKLQSWVFAITRNTIIDYYRKKATQKNVSLDTEIETNLLEEVLPDTTLGLDQCIHSMIGLLPEEYKNIIIDSELKGIKQKDLADKYGMAYPSLRSRVQRGRERLKQLFYNCCQIETDRHGNILDVQARPDCNGPCEPCSE